MRAVNLDTYNLSLLTAKEDILNARTSTNWALFTYDGVNNNLKLSDSGAGGLTELVEKFHTAKPMYGLCRVGMTETGQPGIVMICWVGEEVDELRQAECASHVPAIKNFFKEAVFINASKKDDVTEEKIKDILAKVRPPMERMRRNSRPTEKEEMVGTNYKKTNAAMEMRWINRDTFWARAEREEEQRKEEEKRRAAEERRRLERERLFQERKEAEERDRKMNEKLQMIEEQRRMEAKLEEQARRKEKAKWEVEQREHEEEMRARLRRSESIEKAAEAAALISQRSMNPREFFRQLSSSSLQSPSPVSPRSGKPPFRRYQRSLTDTAFIFERASTSSGPTSPLSPSFTSPFSRTATSPFNRSISPSSPTFRPITSPPCPRAPVRSPPAAPPQRSPPTLSSMASVSDSKPPPPESSLPGLPASHTLNQTSVPVAPNLQASLGESKSEEPSVSRQESDAFPVAAITPVPENPPRSEELSSSTCVWSELKPEMDFKVEAVLVEESEEEEEEDEEEEEEKESEEPGTAISTSSEPKTTAGCPAVVEEERPTVPHLEATVVVSSLVEVEEPADEDPAESVDQAELESSDVEEPTLVELPEDEIEVDISDETETFVRTTENGLNEEDKPDQNGICTQNGTAKDYVDSSEGSTPEKGCYIVNREESDEEEDIELEEASENGQSSCRPLLSVRALYDYQAEDDTELSFEPGDIISDVETVDKSWWRGFSKDGRQGLFPANYVETI